MTQKDYIAVAEIIKSELSMVDFEGEPISNAFASGQLAGIEKIAYRVADLFAGNNSNFKRQKFMRACGL